MTAVEWLIFHWLELDKKYYGGEIGRIDYRNRRYAIQAEAKEMEKDQICTSYVYGSAYGIDIDNNLSPQNYYNEKFNHESNN